MIILQNDILLGYYLSGLFEGDGHIWIPNINPKKKNNPRFCITFSLKNEHLANIILKKIGYGHIRYKPKDNACVLTVSPVKGLKSIVDLLNGRLRTPKINQLYSLIDWLNFNHSSNIEKLGLDKSSLSSNNWLAGFVDADGSFSIQYTKTENGAKKRKISCRLRIEQRMLDPKTKNSYKDVLTNICDFLYCNLNIRNQVSTGNNYYTLTASSRHSLQIIINYFDKFSLLSTKYLDYRDWREGALLILDNNHYTELGINKIESLKNNMNRKRTHFYWDHLN